MITAAVSVTGLLRPIDLFVYEQFYVNSEKYRTIKDDVIRNKVIYIEIPTNNDFNEFLGLEVIRGQVANALDMIGSISEPNKDPAAVILDISFSHNPIAIDSIRDAVDRLKQTIGDKVYGVYEYPYAGGQTTTYADHEIYQASVLYDSVFTGGRLNNWFNTHSNKILSYDSFELIGTKAIPSLPITVVNDYTNGGNISLVDSINYPLPIIPYDLTSFKDNTYVFKPEYVSSEYKTFTSQDQSIDLNDKFIIIGTDMDRPELGESVVPGPYIVISAVIDQLNGNEHVRPSHDNILVQLTIVLLYAIFVCLIFAVIYKYVKKLQTLPYLIAILAFILGIVLLIGLGLALMEYTILRPAFPTLSMLWAAVLCWHFTKKFLVTGIMEGGEVYDVFISYSHGDSYWVKKNLFNPLNEYRKPDGSKLKIFFDEKSIGVGELFTTKYMRGIVDSKLFVPVMSREYYQKNHCRNEMDLAAKRHVEKLIGIFIIALNYEFVPEEFTNINYVDINSQPDFINKLQKELVEETNEELDTLEVEAHTIDAPEVIEQKVYESPVADTKPDAPIIVPQTSESTPIVTEVKTEQENIVKLDTSKRIEKGIESTQLDKGIIIINNGEGQLTLSTSSGITLTLNNNKAKKKKKKKKAKSSKKKGKKRKSKTKGKKKTTKLTKKKRKKRGKKKGK